MDYQRILYSEISFVPHKRPITTNSFYETKSVNTNNNNKTSNNNNNNSNHIGSNNLYSKNDFNTSGNHNGNNVKSNGTNGTTSSNSTNDKPTIPSNQVNNNNNYNNETFQAPKHQLCDPNLIKLDWTHAEKIGGGLINCGNTCFLNSVLQCLTYCPPLYNYLVKLNGGHSNSCKINQFCMLCEMEKHIKRIKGSNGTPIKPNSIVQRLKYINKSFQFGRQEDAHEFLRYIIDHMVKACLINEDINCKTSKLDPRIKETTFINQIFGGYHRSQVLCLTCNSRSNTYDFFMDFILDIKNSKSLEDSLRKFTQPETLENENAYKCGKCRKKVTAKKRFSVYRAPNVATFQLKRFEADRLFGGKLTKFVSYPEELDLRPYMSESSKVPIKYLLSGVLVHVGGSTNSGHYYCYVKNSNGLWYRMDDSYVSVVNKNVVLQQQAYVLFYTKKPGDPQKPAPSNCGLVYDRNISANSNGLVNDNNNNNISNPTTPNGLSHNKNNPTSSNGHLHNKNNVTNANGHVQNKTNQSNSNGHVHDKGSPIIANGIQKVTSANSNNNNNNTNNPKSTHKPLFMETWLGLKSKLTDEDSTTKRKNESTNRDKFNEELDQGKTKKIRTQIRDERFSNLAKTNPFQRYTNNWHMKR